jgi:hypothetical protein
LRERFRLMEETDLLKVLAGVVHSLEATRLLEQRGFIPAPEGGFNKCAEPAEPQGSEPQAPEPQGSGTPVPEVCTPSRVPVRPSLTPVPTRPSCTTPGLGSALRTVPLTPNETSKTRELSMARVGVLPALERRRESSATRSVAELRSVFESPVNRGKHESPASAPRRSFEAFRQNSAESLACFGIATPIQKTGSTPARRMKNIRAAFMN